MKLKFPPRTDGTVPEIDTKGRQIVIIGANGAGKSRFANRLAADLGPRAYRLSALEGLYGNRRDVIPADDGTGSVATLYNRLRPFENVSEQSQERLSELQQLMSMLMHDEMLNLLSYKLAHAEKRDAELRPTKLDSVISLWQEVFPGNRILIESGRFLFSRKQRDDSYSALKLSDGEQAVIYYIAAVLYAPRGAAIFINSPEIFLHPTIMQQLWNRIEALRPDCSFIYTTHDLDFASSREGAQVIWVRDFDAATMSWDYSEVENRGGISDEIYKAVIGARKPVLFIEGDGVHSIDSKLYPLIFKEYTVKSLGSCNKVIEATRTFNDLNSFHHLDSCGIVDRDRRDAHEVEYLRGKRVMVPEVAEIENIMMLEEVIKAVAARHGADPARVFAKVSHAVISMFEHDLKSQALMHTRHRVKRTVEYRIDGKFNNIAMFERHIAGLVDEIAPRRIYEEICREFRRFVSEGDYLSVLKVYNQKSMLPGSNVASLCGLHNKEEYIADVIEILRRDLPGAEMIRRAVRRCLNIPQPGEAQKPI